LLKNWFSDNKKPIPEIEKTIKNPMIRHGPMDIALGALR
jgi:hypothetical protein